VSEERERQARNEIFGGQGSNVGMPARNVMKDDFGFEIPVEAVPLPSRGLVYPVDSVLHALETLDIRSMTAREEDILTSRSLIKKGTVITELIKSCLINKSIDVNEMIAGDRNAIMTALRITGYGSEYKVEVDCPACSERSKQNFNLAELPIKRLEIDPVAEGANLFEFELPATKKNVRFKFLTGKDEEEITITMERKKKTGLQGENLITTRLKHSLVAVGTVNDVSKVSAFIRHMPAKDSLALRQFMDKHEPGIDMKSWMDCPHCLESSEVRLPMGASFFWPDSD
tara:strand:- start:4013 stop:4870 length:858 start_codon:yes stop_codon:yes gene_type:complete